MRKLLTLVTLFLSLQLSASEQLLLTVTSDGMDGTLQLKAIVDEYDEAKGLVLYKIEDPKYKRAFAASELPRGIVMLEIDKHEVVKLHSRNFDESRGGTVIVDYLSSGINKSRAQIELEVIHDGRKWIVLHNREPVTQMFMEARKIIFGKVIGIKDVHTK